LHKTILAEMAEFALHLTIDDMPEDVRNGVGLLLLDAIGVAIANRQKPFVCLQASVVDRTILPGKCTVIGSERRYVAEGAAQLNSTAIHGSDFDATHLPSIMHTSAVIFPVALAVGEEVEANGKEFVASVVAGCEILIRMGLATQGAMHRLGFQSTALCAPVALSFVAGHLRKMSAEQIVNSAGLAASIGAGLRAFSDDGTWGKRLITGWACRAALATSALAQEGYPGTPDALEKEPFGLYKAFVQSGGYDLSQLTKGLGEDWHSREIDLKRYPCSHGHHAFLDTARRAKQQLGLRGEDVASVKMHVSSEARKWWFEPREKKYELANPYGARFSMPYTMALVLQYGNLFDEHLEDEDILKSREIQRLVLNVTPKIDDTLSNTNPNRLPGTIEITQKDGGSSTFPGAGHSLSGDAFRVAVEDKFELNVSNAEHLEREEVIARAENVCSQPSLESLMRLLRF